MKKFYLLTKTLLVAALLMVGATNAWGDRVLYSQDYESATDASSWVTQNLSPTLTTGDATYGKYIQVGPAGNTTNSRSSYTVWGDSFYRDYTTYTLEFDANFTMTTGNTGNKSSSFAIMADGYSLPSANYSYSSDYIFKFNSVANSTTFSINEESAEYTMPSGVWCHYTIVVNGSAGTATYTITNKSTSTQLATGTYNIPDGKSYKAVGMYYLCGRYNSIGKFDNISIKVTPISATLDHTAGAQWGSNTGASTVDANQEHYNGDAGSGWAGCAYARFSYTIPDGHVITSATLNYTMVQSNNSNQEDYIYYMNKDFDLDWATFAGQTGNDLRNTSYRSSSHKTQATVGQKGGGKENSLSVDVTDYVINIAEQGQEYIIFQWTGNAGGGDLYGKGADAAKRPTLVIETAPEVLVAIEDCEAHETSSAFATAVEAQSFANASEVYTFHTNWQIENAGTNDITKVIFDAEVSDFTRWNNARNNSGQQYSGAPDNKYFDAWNNDASDGKQKIYGLPAGTYTLKVATRASADITDKSKYNVWVSGGSANVSVLGSHIGGAGGSLGNGWNWTILSFTLDAKADVEVGFYSCPPADLWAGCDDFHLYKGTLNVSGTITPAGWSTFSSTLPLDLSTISGGTAYYASASGESTVTLTPTTATVPAGEGLMIKGEPNAAFTINVAASGTAIDGNLLKATDGSEIAKSPESGAGNYHYVFGYKKPAEVVTEYGFYNLASNTEVAAGKAYLEITKGETPARALRISLAGITEVENIEAEPEATAKKNGAYLENGKIAIYKNGMKFNAAGAQMK